ncbi:MAG: hypothetical protein ACETWG_10325 [Candidatus Neomarinimicrobiota bacterium]
MKTPSHHEALSSKTPAISAWLVLVLLMGTFVHAAKPEAVLRGLFVYPRSDLSSAESLVWQGQLNVRQQVDSRVSWNLLGDITSRTLTRADGLRIYSGYIQLKLTPIWEITLGRQVQWNSMHTTRLDGVALNRQKGIFRARRQLTLYVGVTPQSEIRTDYGDAGTAVAGGILRRTTGPTHYTVQFWTNQMEGEQQIYVGGSLRRRFGSRITQVSDLAVKVLQPAVETIRLRTQVRLSPTYATYIQYRYSGHLTASPYPWYDEVLAPRHAISAGVHLRPLNGIQLHTGFVQQLGDNQGHYMTAQLALGGLQFSWHAHTQTSYGGQYLMLGGQHTMGQKIKLGGSIGTSTYTLFDDHSPAVEDLDVEKEEQSALAATFWVQGYGGRRLGYRLFAQYTRNRFFKQDGRIGLHVSYVL